MIGRAKSCGGGEGEGKGGGGGGGGGNAYLQGVDKRPYLVTPTCPICLSKHNQSEQRDNLSEVKFISNANMCCHQNSEKRNPRESCGLLTAALKLNLETSLNLVNKAIFLQKTPSSLQIETDCRGIILAA